MDIFSIGKNPSVIPLFCGSLVIVGTMIANLCWILVFISPNFIDIMNELTRNLKLLIRDQIMIEMSTDDQDPMYLGYNCKIEVLYEFMDM